MMATHTSVLADIDSGLPGQSMHTIATAVRAAIGDVLGPGAIARIPGGPHVALPCVRPVSDRVVAV
ncbi:hypothetical protein ACQPYA_04255 [Micromonospora sp. CA-263727]|uniref:hypothetical protein n=1 Tax=Micromonospora sp. CA-263727 TaxID=3239967 RepID=UPI003D8FAB27